MNEPTLPPGTDRFFAIPGHPGKFVYGSAEACKVLEELFLKGVL